MKAKLPASESLLESLSELGAEDFLEDSNRQQEFGMRCDPFAPVWSQASSWNDAMDMRMMLQLLVPGVEYAEEPDVGAESLWIASDFDEGFCTGPEQKVVNDSLV